MILLAAGIVLLCFVLVGLLWPYEEPVPEPEVIEPWWGERPLRAWERQR